MPTVPQGKHNLGFLLHSQAVEQTKKQVAFSLAPAFKMNHSAISDQLSAYFIHRFHRFSGFIKCRNNGTLE
jgi:hypothetical protein